MRAAPSGSSPITALCGRESVMNTLLPLALSGLGTTLALMLIAWLISVRTRNVAIVDVFWGIAIAGAGLSYLYLWPVTGTRGVLVALLAAVWAVRLGAHLLWRNQGRPEDRRYREIRARNEPNFSFKSLWLVFGLQAVLAWLVAMPLLGGVISSTPVGSLDRFGTLLWAFGLVFETVADYQLVRFQQAGGAERGVMDSGLWRFSRHPNYFGEFVLWWGIGLIAVSGGAWWALIGPLLLSLFLLKVSGIALTEKDIAMRRPEYQDYVRRTSAFVPRPPR
jgi:steroid 5-alpha reductase family enzyme